jgi:O-antigen/teichoic acid export membrane protein
VKAGSWLRLSCIGYYFFAELGNVMLSYLGTPEETLKFNIALPIALMIRPLYAISEVFAPLSNQLFQDRDTRALRRSVWSMLGVTALMMIGAGVVFGFLGRWIVTLLFGAEFADAAPCTLILIEGALIWNAARFYADILNSMRRERFAALIAAGLGVLSVALYWIFCSRWGADGAAWAALIASVVWLLAVLVSVLSVLNHDRAAGEAGRAA